MTAPLASTLRSWLADGRPAARITVTGARGSTPREAGATMIVTADELRGTIGGGRLEWEAVAAARDFLRGEHELMVVELPLGPAIGQCCGGHVTLMIERADQRMLAAIEAAEHDAREVAPQILVFGAGHVGRALARALSLLPVRIRWIDERAGEFGPSAWPENIEIAVTPRWAEEMARAPAGAACLVLTHSHALDSLITAAALERGDFAYVGLIGSLTKRRRFERAFREIGLSRAQIAPLVCPIGDVGVRDKRPEIIAALVAAELIQVFARSVSARGEHTRHLLRGEAA